MPDYEAVPAGWSWLLGATPQQLETLSNTDRFISLQRHDDLFDVVSVNNQGADQTLAGWTIGSAVADLVRLVETENVRLISIDAFAASVFTATWVDNSGAFQRHWGWKADLTALEVGEICPPTRRRIVSLTTYMSGDERLYAVVWVDNAGGNAWQWSWSPDLDFESLRQRLETDQGRLISLDPFFDRGTETTRFAAVWAKNTGAHGKGWWFSVGKDADEVGLDCELTCSHLVEARRLPETPGTFGEFHYGFPRSEYADGADLVRLSGTATLNSVSVADTGSQSVSVDVQVENVSGQLLEIVSENFVLTWHGWRYASPDTPDTPFLNINQLGPGTTTPYRASFATAMAGLTHAEAKVHVKAADDRRQLAMASIPILAPAPAQPPHATDPSVPVALGLWTNPMDVVPLWMDDKQVNWLPIGGMICNWTNEVLRIAYLHIVVLDPSGTIIEERDLNYDLRDVKREPLPPADPAKAYAQIDGPYAYFVDGLLIDNKFDPAQLTVRLTCGYKLPGGWCGEAKRVVEARYVEPLALTPPVAGTWSWNNATPHADFDTHAHWREQYSYDLAGLKEVDGSWVPYDGDAGDNASYVGYNQPVRAAADGEVLSCTFSNVDENNGDKKDAFDAPANFVVLGHGGPGFPRRTQYLHLRPQPHPEPTLIAGDTVSAGDTIGFVGNTGHSGGPHLHFTHLAVDATGRVRPYPFKFPGRKALTTQADAHVTGLPSPGIYVSS